MNATTQPPAGYAEQVASGLAFTYYADSHRSADRMGYYPMVSAVAYSRVVVSLGLAAELGDFYASAVHKALTKVSPYLNGHQIMAGIAQAFFDVVVGGWFDAATNSSPEPGRYSDNEHDTTPEQAALLLAVLGEVTYALTDLGGTPGIGWALKALLEEQGAYIRPTSLPHLFKYFATA